MSSAAALVLTGALLFPGFSVFADTDTVSDTTAESRISDTISNEEQPSSYTDEIRSVRISADGVSVEVVATLSEATAKAYDGCLLYTSDAADE